MARLGLYQFQPSGSSAPTERHIRSYLWNLHPRGRFNSRKAYCGTPLGGFKVWKGSRLASIRLANPNRRSRSECAGMGPHCGCLHVRRFFRLNQGIYDVLTEKCRRLGNPGFCQLDLNLLQLSKSKDSVTTNHPMAKKPIIPIMQYPFEDGHCSIAIEIVGPYLALLVVFPGNRDSPDRLWVFEWQTGNVKYVSQRTIYSALSVHLLSR